MPTEKLEITGDTKMFGDLKLSTGTRSIHVTSLSVITGFDGVELMTFDESSESTLVSKPFAFTGATPADRSIVVSGDEPEALKVRTFYGLDFMDIDTTTGEFALQMYADLSFTAAMTDPKIILTPGLVLGLEYITRSGVQLMSFDTTPGKTPDGPLRRPVIMPTCPPE